MFPPLMHNDRGGRRTRGCGVRLCQVVLHKGTPVRGDCGPAGHAQLTNRVPVRGAPSFNLHKVLQRLAATLGIPRIPRLRKLSKVKTKVVSGRVAVKSCTKDICGNPAPEQVEKLFWGRETGLLAAAQISLFPRGKGSCSLQGRP